MVKFVIPVETLVGTSLNDLYLAAATDPVNTLRKPGGALFRCIYIVGELKEDR